MGDVGSVMIRLGAVDAMTPVMDRAAGRLNRFGSRMKSAGRRMTTVGGGMARAVTLPVLGAGAAVLKTAADFESGMKRVEALTGATGESLANLEDLAKELGRTSQFSASEAAEGMGFLAQAGFEADDIMSSFSGTVSLASAGQLELARAADIASNVLKGYGMDVDDIGRVNDVLAKTSTSANTSVDQLGEAMKMVAPIAKSSGLAFEETSAALGALGDAGIQGTMAGTTLRGMLAALESPSGQAASAIEELGLRTHDAQGELLPLTDIVGQLEDKGLSSADAMEIFGRRAGPGMAALVEEGSDSLAGLTDDLVNSGGHAQEVADKQMEGLLGAMRRLRAAFEGVAIAIAESGLIDWAAKFAEKVANLLTRLGETNPTLLKVATIVALVAAAVGPLLVVVGLLVTSIGALIPVVAAISAPVLLVVGAIAALVAGLVVAYAKSETFRDVVNSAFAAVRDLATEVWPQVRDIVTSVLDIIEGAIRFFTATAEAIWRTWGDTISTLVSEVWGGIKQVIGGVLDVIGGLLEVFAGLFSGDWSRMWEGMKQVASGLSQVINGIVDAFFGQIRALVDVVTTAVSSLWSDMWGALQRRAESQAVRLMLFFKMLPTRIKDALGDLASLLRDAGKNLIVGLIVGIKAKVGEAIQAVKDAVGSAVDAGKDFLGISSPSTVMAGLGSDTAEGFIRGVQARKQDAADALAEAMGGALPDGLADSSVLPGSVTQQPPREGDTTNIYNPEPRAAEDDIARANRKNSYLSD